MGSLFDEDFGEDNSPEDLTQITTTILYFSEEELRQFKKLCKIEIKNLFGDKAPHKGNISDVLLLILKERHAGIDTKETIN